MKKRLIAAALLGCATLANAQPAASASAATTAAKKELVQRFLVLQQPAMEQLARSLVERPAGQMLQEVAQVMQRDIAPDKREALGKQVEVEVKKYVEESVPLVRERAIKLAPATFGPMLEEKFSEEELKQLIAWFESPVNKKFQQAGPEMQNAFVQKLLVDARPVVDPKLQALDARLRVLLGAGPALGSGASAPVRPATSSSGKGSNAAAAGPGAPAAKPLAK